MGGGGGDAARDAVPRSLSTGLVVDGFCLLVRLSMYDSTVSQVLLYTHTHLRDIQTHEMVAQSQEGTNKFRAV